MAFNEQWQDPTVRPQDDFYQHCVGAWVDTFEIPADKADYVTFTGLHDQAQEQSKAIIEELSAAQPAPDTNAGKIGVLYNAFMDTDEIDRVGLEPLADLFAEVDALTSTDELPGLFGRFEREGVASPLGGVVHQDNRDSTKYVLDMWQGGIGLPDRDYYLNDEFASVREQYRDHVARMLQRCGVGTAEDAATIVAMETKIAQAHWSQVANRDPVKTYNQYRLTELSDVTPGYDWQAYLGAAGVLDRIETINIGQPDYAQAFTSMIANVPLEDWRVYLRWRILSSFTAFLSEETVQASFDFYGKVLRGTPELRPRWKRGVELVEGMLGEALGQEYVARHFPPENKARMLELVDNVLTAFETSIDGLAWMTDKTKAEAHEKLKQFTAKIGYPDRWKDYSAMTLEPGALIASVRGARAFHHDYEVNKLGGPVDRDEWHMTPQTVNAYYNPEMNEIVFPAGILQPPFFDMAADDAVNYGAIGAVIGHEISHGFDDSGCQFDGQGNLRNWWTDSDHEAFSDRTKMLVEQYGEYEPVEGHSVNGELTLGENIADVSGVAVAMRAYQISLDGQPAPVIDGLSGEQRFFVGYAHVWRGKTRREEIIRRLTVDPHSPPKLRVVGTLMNTDAFFEAFDVQPGDGMWREPAERVRIW